MHPLLTLPYLTIYLHQGPVPVLELSWHSYAKSADFQTVALQALAFSQQYRVQAWVADDRQLGAVRPSDTVWAEQAVLLPLSESGLQRFALLDSEAALNKLILGDMHKRVQSAVTYEARHFTDLAEARAWALGLVTNA